MSNKPVQFKRKKRESTDPHPVEIGDETFLFEARIGSKALEPISRLEADDITAMFQTISALLVERPDETAKVKDGEDRPSEDAGSSFARFVALDLDLEDELPEVFALIIGLYGLKPGESEASSDSSGDDEASSTPTSDASTRSTSKRLKSA